MDKIEQLEKRIEELEQRMDETFWLQEDVRGAEEELTQLFAEVITRDKRTVTGALLNMYSKDNLPEGSKHLCVIEAIEKVKNRNCAVKLKHWKSYKKALQDNRS